MADNQRVTGNLNIGPREGDDPAVYPLYKKILSEYKQTILEHRLMPGDRIESITGLQTKYRISRETAKKVLNLLADEGLIEQHAGKGSFVAKPRDKKSVWGVVLPFYSIQYEDLLARIADKLAPRDRELRHFCDYNSWENEIRMVGSMLRENYEAVIVIPTMEESKTKDFYLKRPSFGSPIVFLDHTMTNYDYPCVIQSYDLGLVRGMRRLLETTHRTIALVKNDTWSGMNMIQEHLVETYEDFLQKQRPGARPLVLSRVSDLSAAMVAEKGIEGIFCCDDISAAQVIGRIGEQGIRVPGDIRVVSYGNTDVARYFTPAITSVDSCNEEMASNIVELLGPVMSGGAIENRRYVAQPEVIVRGT
ncbi:MAG: GntR family transcriptional regulator [Spirochaetes bacterium]|nr:MAG: GntR family transcriptional regulator [Spirochaetota bacterium]